jgi:hypothetical protein
MSSFCLFGTSLGELHFFVRRASNELSLRMQVSTKNRLKFGMIACGNMANKPTYASTEALADETSHAQDSTPEHASAGSLTSSAISGDINLRITIPVIIVGVALGVIAVGLASCYAKKELNRVIEKRREQQESQQEGGPTAKGPSDVEWTRS